MTDELHEINVGQTPETDAAKASWLERVVQAANYAFRRSFQWQSDFSSFVISTFAYAAYGGMSSSGTATTTIGAGWDTLQCDTVSPVPRHLTVDLINNSLSWPVVSTNALSIALVLTHNESNASRTFNVRVWNLTKSVWLGAGAPVGIARNQSTTNVAMTIPVTVASGYENDQLQFQVGGTGDAITVISWDAIRIWSWNVGEYQGAEAADVAQAGASTSDIASIQAQIAALQSQAAADEALTWDDLRFPATAVNPPGQASDPAWDNNIPGWLFSSAGTEVIHLIAQLPHTWDEGSDVKPHLHWTKTSSAAGDVYWQLEYAWSAIGEVIEAFTTVSETTTVAGTPDNDTENEQLITAFPAISGAGKKISDTLLMKLSRVGGDAADTYSADARLLEFDIHYRRHPLSSINEYSRT